MKKNYLAVLAAVAVLVLGTAGIMSARGTHRQPVGLSAAPAATAAQAPIAKSGGCDAEDEDTDKPEAKKHSGEEHEHDGVKRAEADDDEHEHECRQGDDTGPNEDGPKGAKTLK